MEFYLHVLPLLKLPMRYYNIEAINIGIPFFIFLVLSVENIYLGIKNYINVLIRLCPHYKDWFQ